MNAKDEYSDQQANTVNGLAEDDFDWGKLLDLDDQELKKAIAEKQASGSSLEALSSRLPKENNFDLAANLDFNLEIAGIDQPDWEHPGHGDNLNDDFNEEGNWTELLGGAEPMDWENSEDSKDNLVEKVKEDGSSIPVTETIPPAPVLDLSATFADLDDLDDLATPDHNDWEKITAQSPDTQSWATDDVNTEFMMEWEKSAARISQLTGLELTEGAPTRSPKKAREVDTESSGVLPPLPNLPPKSRSKSPQKSSDSTQTKSSIDTGSWFEEFQEEVTPKQSVNQAAKRSLKPEPRPEPNYDFDQLAEEICDDGNANWSDALNVNKKQPTPLPILQKAPPPPPSNSYNWAQYNAQPEVVVVDLEDSIEPTAVWQQPSSFTEPPVANKSPSGFSPKLPQLPRLTIPQLPIGEIWQKVKIPVFAIAAISGLYAIFSIPFVQKGTLELGLKLQIFKDATGKDLSDLNFKEAKLDRVNFGKANLKGTNLVKASLNNANLNGANLIGADLTGANLRGADLKNSKIDLKAKKPTKFDAKYLLMWRLLNEPLVGRNLTGQSLDGFYLNSVMLKRANLTDSQLSWVNFTKADLSEALLVGANLKGANLVGANLRGADLTAVKWEGVVPKTDETTICPNGSKGACKF